MISDPELVAYASVSRNTTILAEFTAGDPEIDALASIFTANPPQFHSVFSHTTHARTFTFVIDLDFVYFGAFHVNLGKTRGLRFLNRVKGAFQVVLESESIASFENLTSYCFQESLNPIFRELLDSTSMESEVALKKKKKKKRNERPAEDGVGDVGKEIVLENDKNNDNNDNAILGSVDAGVISVPEKNVLREGGGSRRARLMQRWRRHVCVVLVLDLVVCSLFFGIWVWICKGFNCVKI